MSFSFGTTSWYTLTRPAFEVEGVGRVTMLREPGGGDIEMPLQETFWALKFGLSRAASARAGWSIA